MTELLEQAIAALRRLPPHEQDVVARALLEVLPEDGLYRLTDEDRVAIEISREQVRRGEFVSDAEMDALWARWLPTKE